jgi:UDP-N-acetylmuramate--alanine ligase
MPTPGTGGPLPMDQAILRTSGNDPGPGQAHLVGVCERGMSGLAQTLVQRGYMVTGSERGASQAVDRLRQLGVRVHAGHSPGHVPHTAQLVVYAPEITRDHPERLKALQLGVPQTSYVDMIARLMSRGTGIAVAGSRAASAAAAMVGWTLAQAGFDPTVVLGSAVPQLGGWGRLGQGMHCVVEAVEVLGTLAPESPQMAVLFHLDHPRFESDPEARESVLRGFAAGVSRHGYVLGSGGSAQVVRAVEGLEATVEMFSLRRGCAWWGTDLREERGRFRFRAFHRGRFVVEARLQVAGRRNVLSALAAVAVCDRLAVPAAAIKEGLEEFAGLSRGLESRGSWRGVTLVDDEAHDPRSVAEALAVCRQVFGRRRLWSVVRPEAPAAWAPFATAFAAADQVLVAEGVPLARRPGALALVQALASAGVQARWVAGLDGAVADLDQRLQPGDVLLTLGDGDVGKVADALTIRRIPFDRHGC